MWRDFFFFKCWKETITKPFKLKHPNGPHFGRNYWKFDFVTVHSVSIRHQLLFHGVALPRNFNVVIWEICVPAYSKIHICFARNHFMNHNGERVRAKSHSHIRIQIRIVWKFTWFKSRNWIKFYNLSRRNKKERTHTHALFPFRFNSVSCLLFVQTLHTFLLEDLCLSFRKQCHTNKTHTLNNNLIK